MHCCELYVLYNIYNERIILTNEVDFLEEKKFNIHARSAQENEEVATMIYVVSLGRRAEIKSRALRASAEIFCGLFDFSTSFCCEAELKILRFFGAILHLFLYTQRLHSQLLFFKFKPRSFQVQYTHHRYTMNHVNS